MKKSSRVARQRGARRGATESRCPVRLGLPGPPGEEDIQAPIALPVQQRLVPPWTARSSARASASRAVGRSSDSTAPGPRYGLEDVISRLESHLDNLVYPRELLGYRLTKLARCGAGFLDRLRTPRLCSGQCRAHGGQAPTQGSGLAPLCRSRASTGLGPHPKRHSPHPAAAYTCRELCEHRRDGAVGSPVRQPRRRGLGSRRATTGAARGTETGFAKAGSSRVVRCGLRAGGISPSA